MYDLNGKVALVTGAGSKSGIGHATAIRLAGEGADVIAADRYLPPEGLSEDDHIDGWRGLTSVVEEIESLGRRTLAVKVDISDSGQVQDMVGEVLDRFGRIDILVNNAGIGAELSPVIEFDDKTWNRIIEVNLTGTYLCSKYIARSMVEKGDGGKIINISSISGKVATKGAAAYSASKFGIIGLTQTLALELASYSINVNAVCPGVVPTDISGGGQIRNEARRQGIGIEEATDQIFSAFIPRIPLGRIASPDDIAGVVAFLASCESDYMTGLAISVSGGMVMS